MPTPVDVTYFPSAIALRKWFQQNHATARELWVGFHRKQTGIPSVTWPESVDEALCVGWIDGIRKRIDGERYTIRFTPRRRESIWSAVNIKRVGLLSRTKRMRPSGRKAFEARQEHRSGIYAYEQRKQAVLDEGHVTLLKKDKAAWAFFERLPPSHRTVLIWWISSAKREETRAARLHKLIEASRRGKRLF
ncbi:MAG TPA: YdeI/OmpD-associated family protein [Vicinamibacterales bacterium]|nr:YdeI/OmpD-associated family protein [Vicinamibacterales bacterium]